MPHLRVDPPPCDFRAAHGHTRLVCDDNLHLTDRDGQASCASCSKVLTAPARRACPRCARVGG